MANDVYEQMRRIRDRDQQMNVQGYSTNPWQTQMLANSKPGVDVPIAGAKVPRNLVMAQDADGKWWGNKPMYGPFDSLRDLELAVFGRTELGSGKWNYRDGLPW
jgi:hypothetical protein